MNFDNLSGYATYFGRRTKAGMMLRLVDRGQRIAQWFIKYTEDRGFYGPLFRMESDGGETNFVEVTDASEEDDVMFFMRRGCNRSI